MEMYLFGQPRLARGADTVELGLRKGLALLTFLAISKGEYSREYLATLLWPELDEGRAKANVRRMLYQINKTLQEDLLIAQGDALRLNPAIALSIDVERFRHLVETVFDRSVPFLSDAQQIDMLEEAAALYTDDFLMGFSLPNCEAFVEWRFFEAESLQASLVRVLERLIEIYQEQGKYEPAIEHGRRILALDELNEDAHRSLMRLYAGSNQYAAALRQYQACTQVLEQELGVAPQPATTQLMQAIRQKRPLDRRMPVSSTPPVHYIASGDVHIAYQVVGDGPVDMILVGGFISHLDLIWKEPALAAFLRDLGSFSRLILFDKRGVGLSDRVGYPPTLEDTMDDILAVMRGAHSRHAVLFGWLEGGPNSVLLAATYPEHVTGLVLYGTYAKGSRAEDYPWMIRHDQYDIWLDRLTKHWGDPLNIEHYAPSRATDPALRSWWARMLRVSSSPGGMKAVLEVMRDIDVRQILPVIRTPTLVLHRSGDLVIRAGAGRHLASQIPGARYVELEGVDHWPFIGAPQSILDETRAFIQNLDQPLPPERMLLTILILRAQSAHGAELQGASAPVGAVINEAFLRSEISRFRGEEIAQAGDRFIVSFDGPSRAIHCAKSLLNSTQALDLTLQACLHTGECEWVAGEVQGLAIRVADAMFAAGGQNEILVSRTVKDLVAGSGFAFEACETCEVEGTTDAWDVFRLKAGPQNRA